MYLPTYKIMTLVTAKFFLRMARTGPLKMAPIFGATSCDYKKPNIRLLSPLDMSARDFYPLLHNNPF